jgi:hypothetical protein
LRVFRPKSEIKAEFKIPHYQKKIELDETSLILINEKFSPKLMMQFGYESLGKSHNSKIMLQIEQEQMKDIINNKRLLTQVGKEEFFEKKVEKNPNSREIINRYSAFLED